MPKRSAPKRSAPRPVPTAVLRPSSATAIPRKPTDRHGDVGDAEVVEVAEHVEAAGEPGERAGDRHRANQVLLHADAAVGGRVRVEADGAHLVAERRPVEQQPRRRRARRARRRSRRASPWSCCIAPEDRQLRAVGDVVRDRHRRRSWLFWSGPPSPKKYVADPDRDPVEHDRRDHLVRADRRLQEAGDPGPRRRRRASRAPIPSRTCGSGAMPGRLTPTQFAT